ncbi:MULTISPECIES: DUF1778 domain-containing protein [unclassified Pseudofrankia]|uniref:type II toxin-antitoxin system TacA family antitoxin n=1 Tax=unclassified Pseudofrankia TaxID=2994372 RepID=UPI0018E32FC5|nr:MULTISPECIES: DUF1778 domain-containing protein [unclassified Pseudofrankia]MDT3441273.1 DUF1778 domain-containing protein [Pseudofrankia sp. BMG5.37]
MADELIDQMVTAAEADYGVRVTRERGRIDGRHGRPYTCTDARIGGAMVASAASGRFEFRVRPELKQLIERAASLMNQTASDFARTAAEERAVEVLREHELITRVPVDFFDALLASLDAPPEPNDALTRAAARLDSVIERR